tara:strand:- start:90792 stop:91001 length:210 start_codon:yes stop_codon:yes gene_type:complete
MSKDLKLSDDAIKTALSKNNQQIAHDLRSPLSALNFVSSLNAELNPDSRNLLQMAIDRLQEMAHRLETD